MMKPFILVTVWSEDMDIRYAAFSTKNDAMAAMTEDVFAALPENDLTNAEKREIMDHYFVHDDDSFYCRVDDDSADVEVNGSVSTWRIIDTGERPPETKYMLLSASHSDSSIGERVYLTLKEAQQAMHDALKSTVLLDKELSKEEEADIDRYNASFDNESSMSWQINAYSAAYYCDTDYDSPYNWEIIAVAGDGSPSWNSN